MKKKSVFIPRLLPQRCFPRVRDEQGWVQPYVAPEDENERLLSIALELSRIPEVQRIVDRAGIEKDLTDEEERFMDQQTIAMLDRMDWKQPYFGNLIISHALARRFCAGLIGRDDAASCSRYVAERRCEQYESGSNLPLARKEPPARLSDWLPSLHYFQTRQDLWRPFAKVRQRELRFGELFFEDEKVARRIYSNLTAFAGRERVKHALCAWQITDFRGLAGKFAAKRIDCFDDEQGIQAFLETNLYPLTLQDDREGVSHD